MAAEPGSSLECDLFVSMARVPWEASDYECVYLGTP